MRGEGGCEVLGQGSGRNVKTCPDETVTLEVSSQWPLSPAPGLQDIPRMLSELISWEPHHAVAPFLTEGRSPKKTGNQKWQTTAPGHLVAMPLGSKPSKSSPEVILMRTGIQSHGREEGDRRTRCLIYLGAETEPKPPQQRQEEPPHCPVGPFPALLWAVLPAQPSSPWQTLHKSTLSLTGQLLWPQISHDPRCTDDGTDDLSPAGNISTTPLTAPWGHWGVAATPPSWTCQGWRETASFASPTRPWTGLL
jgi:hypothetical protein